MLVNIVRKTKYQAGCLLFAKILNVTIITINTIETIIMPVILYFLLRSYFVAHVC